MPLKKLSWIVVAALLVACLDISDYEIDAFEINPKLALPIAFGDLSVQDLINDSDTAYIKVYPDDLVYLYYTQKLETQDINALFDLTNKSATRSFSLPAGTIPPLNNDLRTDSISSFLDLGLSPEKLSEIIFKQGTFTYTTTISPPNPNLKIEVQVIIPEFVTQSTGAAINFKTNGNGSMDVSPYKVGLNSNKFDFKLVLIYKKNAQSVVVAPGTSINVNLNFSNMDFKIIRGFLGDQTASFPNQSVSIGAFGDALNNSDLSFAQPRVELQVVNEYGVPCRVNFQTFQARKGNASMDVLLNPANPVTLNSPTILGESAITSVSVTNAKELLAFNPDRFVYTANARINAGLTSGNDFLADTSKLTVNMNVEVPLYGKASNIVLADTIDLGLDDIEASTVKQASLRIVSENELPLDAVLQLYLTDEDFTPLGTLIPNAETGVVSSSTVDAQGELVSPSKREIVIELDQETINKIFTAKRLIIKSTLSTTRNGSGVQVDVKFKSNYKLKVNAGLLVDLKIKES